MLHAEAIMNYDLSRKLYFFLFIFLTSQANRAPGTQARLLYA